MMNNTLAMNKWMAMLLADTDSITVPKVLIRLCGNNAFRALVLSEMVNQFALAISGRADDIAVVGDDGEIWVAMTYEDWADECAVSAETIRDMLDEHFLDKDVPENGLLLKYVAHHNGRKRVHLRINHAVFEHRLNTFSQVGQSTKYPDIVASGGKPQILPNGGIHQMQTGVSTRLSEGYSEPKRPSLTPSEPSQGDMPPVVIAHAHTPANNLFSLIGNDHDQDRDPNTLPLSSKKIDDPSFRNDLKDKDQDQRAGAHTRRRTGARDLEKGVEKPKKPKREKRELTPEEFEAEQKASATKRAMRAKMIELFGYGGATGKVSDTESILVNLAVKELFDAGYTLEHIPKIFLYCRRKFKASFGPKAMCRNASLALTGNRVVKSQTELDRERAEDDAKYTLPPEQKTYNVPDDMKDRLFQLFAATQNGVDGAQERLKQAIAEAKAFVDAKKASQSNVA